MFLRFAFLLMTRGYYLMAAAVPAQEAWKTAEILILRHQLTVLQRRQPAARS